MTFVQAAARRCDGPELVAIGKRGSRFALALAFLRGYSADRVPHPGGTLLDHLAGTCALLHAWGSSPWLCLAGLCHAAYGTGGFPRALIGLDQRATLQTIIGSTAERLVYLYCSCDREHLYPRLGDELPPVFKDRFTGSMHTPSTRFRSSFFELTLANELEIARGGPQTLERMRPFLAELFPKCRPFVSRQAYDCFVETCEQRAAVPPAG